MNGLLGLQGIEKNGKFEIDPDGPHLNNPPIDVECNFANNLTIVGEDMNFEFEQCPTIKCSQTTLEYEAETDQIKILMEDSGICSQTIHFHCKNAPLKTVSKLYPSHCSSLASEQDWRPLQIIPYINESS